MEEAPGRLERLPAGPATQRPLLFRVRPRVAGAGLIAGATGFCAAVASLEGAGHFLWLLGCGPYGSGPLWIAGTLALASGALLGRASRPARERGRPEPARVALFGLPATIASAFLLAALHAFFLPALAEGFGRSFLALERAAGAATPGLWAEVFLGLVLLGPPLALAGLVAGSLSGRRAALAGGLLCLGAGPACAWSAAEILDGPPEALGGVAIGFLALALPARWAFAAPRRWSRTADEEEGNIPGSLAGNRAAALALLSILASLAASMLVGGLSRLTVEIAGEAPLIGPLPAAVLIALGIGACAASFMLGPGRTPWRLLARALALAGLAGLLAAGLAGHLPAAYLHTLARAGLAPAGERVALAVLCGLALSGPALLAGAVLGASAASGAAPASLPLLAGGAAAAAALLPVAAGSLGVWGTVLLSSALLAVLGGLLILLEAGSLGGRGLWSLALLAACSFLLLESEPWDPVVETSAVAHHPGLYLEGGRPALRRRTARDRILLRREGPRTSAALKLIEGRSQALVSGGRVQVVDSLEARRGFALAAHLPALLGPERGKALFLAAPTSLTLEALAAHGAFTVAAAIPDPAVGEASLAAGRLRLPGEIPDVPWKFRTIPADARRVLALEEERFDLIIAPPLAREGNLLRTASRRTLDLMRERLAPGGLACLSLPLRGLTREGILDLIARFRESFPGASVWAGGSELFLLGGGAPVLPDLDRAGPRSRREKVVTALAELGLDDPLKLLALRVAGIRAPVAGAAKEGASLRESAARARLRSPYAGNLRWIASHMQGEEAALVLPEGFDEPARESALRRTEVLRQVHGLTLRARAALLDRGPGRALEAAEEAITRDPSDLEARVLGAQALASLGEEAIGRGDPGGAAAAYGRALALDPASLEGLTGLAWLRYTEGDAEGAATLLRRALRAAPWIALLHHRLGLALLAIGEPAAAERSLLKAYDLDPRRAETLILLGDAARGRGQAERALALYERALAVGGRNAAARIARATIHMESGDLSAAEDEVEKALRAKPSDPGALFLRARLRIARGEREGARRDLLAAVAVGGTTYRARGMLDPALRDLLPVGGSSPAEE